MWSLASVLLVLTEKIVMFTAGPLPSPSPPLLLMLLVWNKMKESDRKAWGNLLLAFLAQLSSDGKPRHSRRLRPERSNAKNANERFQYSFPWEPCLANPRRFRNLIKWGLESVIGKFKIFPPPSRSLQELIRIMGRNYPGKGGNEVSEHAHCQVCDVAWTRPLVSSRVTLKPLVLVTPQRKGRHRTSDMAPWDVQEGV